MLLRFDDLPSRQTVVVLTKAPTAHRRCGDSSMRRTLGVANYG